MNLNAESSVCEYAAIDWQETMISEMNEILKKNGVADTAARREILEEFFFRMATVFDGSSDLGIKVKDMPLRPTLAFIDELADPPSMHHSGTYDLHDKVGWFVDELFENDE